MHLEKDRYVVDSGKIRREFCHVFMYMKKYSMRCINLLSSGNLMQMS